MAAHRKEGRSQPVRRQRSAAGGLVGVVAVSTTLVIGAVGAMHLLGVPAEVDILSDAVADEPPPGDPSGRITGDDPATTQASRSSGRSPTVATQPRTGGDAAPGDGRHGGAAFGHASGAMTHNSIPGLGVTMTARVPVESRQAVVVTADSLSSTTNVVTLWERADPTAEWHQVGVPFSGRNGEGGWAANHEEGDLRSPIGVFTLTAAGGRLPDPGTGLPYEYRPSYYQAGDGGSAMAAAFDYVIAVDYNRVPGFPPSDPTRPLGEAAGGDIWLHVDHESPTRGCVGLSREAMEAILHWLSPAAHPVIVMGDLASLSA